MSDGKAPSGDNASGSASHSRGDSYLRNPQPTPGFMTVGTGSTSESASRLVEMLDHDSGYGGSIVDGQTSSQGWHPGLTEDRPTPSHTPRVHGETNPAAENERKILASHVHQLYYNQNKTALARAITRTVDSLKRLQEMNAVWPAHYPSVQRSEPTPSHQDPRPGLQHTQSTFDNRNEASLSSPTRPRAPQRANTSLGESSSQAEPSTAAVQRPGPEPRLVTPQLAQDFSVLKIDLKMGSLHQTDIVHSLEKHSISTLLDNQISKTIRHLYSLRERIEDTSSKVLVTGDLNAGKSTFCNALLRRKVLPEDQQPCTSIFCEVLDVKENGGIEEVHAVPNGVHYRREDERTYSVFELKDLEKIVVDNERWSLCKIYVRDIRSVDASLLNNGVVDIALIDAPGLNNDSLITTANFAKQEEIDVVVFVVSAENHFTQSAKEFVFNAAREKAYIFMVVNRFDNIRDKRRCQEMVLKQIQGLSPATFKESAELVHFVSSNAIPTSGPSDAIVGGGSSGGSGSSSGPGGDDGPGDDGDDEPTGKHGDPGSPMDKGKGKDKEKIRDFAELEQSLRRFVLEKRARSKLKPAQTYLMNLLGDLDSLATVNHDVAQSELDRVTKELQQLEPELEKIKKATFQAGDGTDRTIEDTVNDVYDHTRTTLDNEISSIADKKYDIVYPSLWSAYQYAEDLRDAMLHEIQTSVIQCEDYARQRTVHGVNSIKNLGLLHLGNNFPDFSFRSENMFSRKRDALARQVDVEIEFMDFFDIASLWERQEKVAGTSMAVTVAGVVGGRLIGGVGWLDGALGAVRVMGVNNVRRLIIPGVILVGTFIPNNNLSQFRH
jgi:GTP-binding protein EngB required for normal cell division